MPRAVLLSTMLLVLFGPLGIDLYLPTLPALDQHFDHQGQLSISIFALSMGFGQLLFGPLCDHFGRRTVGIASLIFFLLASCALVFTYSSTQLLIFRSLQGLAAAGTIVVSFALVRDYADGNESAKLFSLLNAVINLVPSLAPLLGGIAMLYWGWQGPFICLAVLTLPCSIFLILYLHEPKRITQPSTFSFTYFHQLFQNNAFLSYGFVTVTAITTILCYVSNAPYILIEGERLTPLTFSFFFGLNGAWIIVASLICRQLLHHFGQIKVLFFGLWIMFFGGLCMLALSHYGGVWHFMVPVAILSFAFALTLGTASSLALSPFPHCAGTAVAILGVFQLSFGSVLSIAIIHTPLRVEAVMGILVSGLALLSIRLCLHCTHTHCVSEKLDSGT